MPSKKSERSKLDSKLNALIRDQLIDALSSFHNKVEITHFLDSILTKAERAMLMKRLAVASLIARGESYAKISKLLNVSPVTIGYIKNKVLKGSEAYLKLIERINRFLPKERRKR